MPEKCVLIPEIGTVKCNYGQSTSSYVKSFVDKPPVTISGWSPLSQKADVKGNL